MKKACFIIPYFGKLPNYFELFAKTCGYNTDYQWLIFTDDTSKYRVPHNVIIKKMSFDEFLNMVNQKFDFRVQINNYHKICDLKPAYGYLFEKYIQDFKFWGYCDLDVVFGNLNDYITPEILSKYDKLFCLGHCVLFKNTYENNRLFMKPVNNEFWYKESFTSPETTVFDETYGDEKNINTIFKVYNKNILEEDWSFNCNIAPANLRRIRYNAENNKFEIESFKNAIYVWSSGKIFRYFLKKSSLIQEEYMYMHFQARKMYMSKSILDDTTFKIMGNGFFSLEKPVSKTTFKKIKHKIYSFRKIKLFIFWKVHGLLNRIRKHI